MLLSARRLVVSVFVVVVGVLVFWSAAALAAAPETPEVSVELPVPAMTATVHGVLNPGVEGGPGTYELGTYEFLYKQGEAGCEGEGKAPASPGISLGEGKEAVTETLQGLSPDTVYTLCLLARSGIKGERAVSTAVTFTTSSSLEAPVTREPASAVTATTATFGGELNPGGATGPLTYQFDYNTNGTCTGGQSTAPVEVIEAKQLQVHAEVTELEANAQYTFCLVSTNAFGGQAMGNGVVARTARHVPRISEVSVANITSGAATVSAQVYAYGEATNYRVEYGTTTSYGSNTPEVSAGSGAGPVGVQAKLTSLTPGTEYHYKIVASNQIGPETTSDATFTTGHVAIVSSPSAGERVDEVVTPVENNENVESHVPEFYGPGDIEDGITSEFGVFQVAADGEAVAYMTSPVAGGYGEEESGPGGDQQLATMRPDGGWTQVLAEPRGKPFDGSGEIQAFSPDFTFGAYETECGVCGLSGAFPEDGPTSNKDGQLYENPGATGVYAPASTYSPLFTTLPPFRAGTGEPDPFGAWEVAYAATHHPTGDGGVVPVFAGASADGSESLFEADDKLTENAVGGEGEDQQTHLPYSQENNLYVSAGGRLSLVNVLPDGSTEANATFGAPTFEGDLGQMNPPNFSNVISGDGSRIFWTDLNTGDLYVRDNPTEPQSPIEGGKCVVLADACTVLISEGARFWTATSDGSKVFFTKGALYEYDLASAQSTDLSEGVSVEGVLGASDNGSYVYYAAEGGKLYVYQEGQKPQFIATVSQEDGTSAKPYHQLRGSSGFYREAWGDWVPGLGHRTAETTPDGSALVFTSEEDLTGYDNEYAGEKLPEVYVYEAASVSGAAHLFCASCSPDNEAPVGVKETIASNGPPAGGVLPVSFKDTFQPTWISEDGSEVFFESLEPLLPQVTNGRMNVFEWQRDGTHHCELPAGCISLLSGGGSPTTSWLIGASENGDDVFMITRAQLAPEDANEYYDVYDARVGGQLPAVPLCTGTGCQGLPAPPPTFATPSSVTFEGVGNFALPAQTVVKPKPKARALTRAQRLVKALEVCGRDKQRRKRMACKARARKHYGSSSRAKKSAKGRS